MSFSKQGVCHIVALPFTFKNLFQGKRRIMEKFKYFTIQKYNLRRNPLKETKILQDIITL
jgi:hypothetical protein